MLIARRSVKKCSVASGRDTAYFCPRSIQGLAHIFGITLEPATFGIRQDDKKILLYSPELDISHRMNPLLLFAKVPR